MGIKRLNSLAGAFVIFIVAFGFFISPANAQTIEQDVSITQQLFSVRPTLEVDELDKYSKAGVLSGGFSRTGLPLLGLGVVVGIGYYVYTKKKRLKCTRNECRNTFALYLAGGVLNAFALFVVINLFSGVLAPSSLQNLAVYIDEQQSFKQGDTIRATFDIFNSGDHTIAGVQFRNTYSKELKLQKESILLEKDGALPEGYLPLTTGQELYIFLGDLEPAESVTISYDFVILTTNENDIVNVAQVFNESGATVLSNTSRIKRGSLDEEHASPLPKSGTWLVQFIGSTEVYYIAPGSVLRLISQENAERLLGPGWQTEIQVLERSSVEGYVVGSNIGDSEIPDGMFLTDGESRCYIEDQICRPVTVSGMQAYELSDRFLRVVSTEIINSFELGELIDG